MPASSATTAAVPPSRSSLQRLNRLDAWLMHRPVPDGLAGLKRFVWEFWFFGLKNARSCLFVGLFFAAVFVTPRAGLWGVPRYDLLLIAALAIQIAMVATRLESWDELKAISLFHVVGFALEVFKTSSGIKSWAYPDFAYTKLWGVPLFSGFMYAAVGSYIIQAWRLFDLRILHHPLYPMAALVAVLIYANFFTHHYIGDYRWYLAACALGLYARTTVVYRPLDRDRRMPLLLAFVLIGFFIWLAENISTFAGVWAYPNQLGAWSTVHVGKWSSWSMLVVMTFTIVANLKHIKRHIHVPA
ncbi:Uncharacterized integral membrane protein [Comamonas terrigena]|jgi:uncharacterized membrane protein YoaT (DUF817 family)|nr:membrane protein [Comamonas terrigena NBRC 13299]SUY92300.1 Uncharacterized integral membrane protein [Comamonas terrigena]